MADLNSDAESVRKADPTRPAAESVRTAGRTGPAGDDLRARSRPSMRSVWVGAIAVMLAWAGFMEAGLWRPDTVFGIRNNPQIGEAQAWLAGRLNLPERHHDTALKDGKVYSHFPPMFSLISSAVVPLFGGVPHGLIVLLIGLPVPLLGYVLFLRRTGTAWSAALLAVALALGTSVYPVMDKALRGANPYNVNQLLATAGLLVLLIEYYGRKRVWVGALALIVAAWSRQLTAAYALPLAVMAWGGGPAERRPLRSCVLLLAGVVMAAVPMALNTLKFGHPLDSGYMHVYADRPEDDFSRDTKYYGLFSLHYIPRNLYYANLGPPRLHEIEMAGEREWHLRPNRMGTGIWWTTPLLIWLFVDWRRIVRDGENRYLLAAAALAFAGLMLYHSTGYEQRGFNRYSLDYVPVLLALVAPHCFDGRRRWVSAAMIAWSIMYFRLLI